MVLRKELENILMNEALARCRYEVFAEIAREEGLHYIAKVLEETAHNELSHVRELMRMLDLIGDTKQNIGVAIENETLETNRIYPNLQEMSLVENDLDKARFFQQLAKIEARHMERLSKIEELLKVTRCMSGRNPSYGNAEPAAISMKACSHPRSVRDVKARCSASSQKTSAYRGVEVCCMNAPFAVISMTNQKKR